MNQLILDVGGYGILMPESQKGGYQAWEEALTVDVEMIPGNMVKEIRGNVWRINYQYGYFDTTTKDRVLAAIKRGLTQPIICSFLPDNSTEMISSEFFVTSYNPPKFMWSSRDGFGNPVPLWADFSMKLREVEPHD